MLILGISELDNDSGVTLVENGQIISAVNEERFSRVKRHRGIPYLSISYVLKKANKNIEDIDIFAIAKPPFMKEWWFNNIPLIKYPWLEKSSVSLWNRLLSAIAFLTYKIPKNTLDILLLDHDLKKFLKKSNIPSHKVVRVEHHRAHAACAFHASGWDEGLFITTDGQGGGVTASVYVAKNGCLKCLHRVPVPHSLGGFYGAATKALGFKPGRHEGKVTGLAAYEAPDNECLKFCRNLVKFKNKSYYAPHVYGSYLTMKRFLKRIGPKAFSASFQLVLEEVVTSFVDYWIKETGIHRIGLAGGVFGNVKLNQKIHELNSVSEIYIFPHMADGGLSYGAAMDQFKWEPRGLNNVYLGPSYSEIEMEKSIIKNNLRYERLENAPQKIATYLALGKVIARFGGSMEFGPRALGNRSILYRPDEPDVNEWLNKSLQRNEFMPFAPVTMEEFSEKCYLGIEGAKKTAENMTITFECTEYMKENAPAVVHVDGTARPQLLKREKNPFYYDIIKYFHEQTGIPCVVNTSFNMHEEPIVCTPDDAIRAFKLGHLDILSMGPFLCYSI